MSRPKKSLHFMIKNPDTNLHFNINPEYRLHLLNLMKRKWALLKSIPPEIIRSDMHINPLLGLRRVKGHSRYQMEAWV